MKRADKVWIGLMDFGNRMGCHQMESRSFFFRGYQFPVCARCTGVILGEIIALFLIIVNLKINLIQSIVLLLIMGLDWFLQYVKIPVSVQNPAQGGDIFFIMFSQFVHKHHLMDSMPE